MSNASNQRISLVELAHSLVKANIKPGSIAIDATVGNGRDTAFLLDLIKPNGKVFGFDIQEMAIEQTLTNLHDSPYLDCLALINSSHADMCKFIPSVYHSKVSAIMFNLGYLPGGDKRIITQAGSTLAALSAARQLLAMDGIITVLAYPGHEGGEMEADQVKQWCLSLNQERNQAKVYKSQSDNPSAPVLFVV